MARRATVISQERAKGGLVLLLDAGDSLAADQDPARATQGRSSIEALNLLGYDALALGPADLALGPAVLRARAAEARFALLSANAVVSATGELVAQPYITREWAGHRVAVVGLSGPANSREITVRDPLATVQKIVAELQRQADVIILLSHAGAVADQLIADAAPGITAIISGGAPALATPGRGAKSGTPIFRADEALPGHAGRVLGVARLSLDGGGKLAEQSWQRVILGPEIASDLTLASWVQEQTNR